MPYDRIALWIDGKIAATRNMSESNNPATGGTQDTEPSRRCRPPKRRLPSAKGGSIQDKNSGSWQTEKFRGDKLICLAAGATFDGAMIQTAMAGAEADE